MKLPWSLSTGSHNDLCASSRWRRFSDWLGFLLVYVWVVGFFCYLLSLSRVFHFQFLFFQLHLLHFIFGSGLLQLYQSCWLTFFQWLLLCCCFVLISKKPRYKVIAFKLCFLYCRTTRIPYLLASQRFLIDWSFPKCCSRRMKRMNDNFWHC